VREVGHTAVGRAVLEPCGKNLRDHPARRAGGDLHLPCPEGGALLAVRGAGGGDGVGQDTTDPADVPAGERTAVVRARAQRLHQPSGAALAMQVARRGAGGEGSVVVPIEQFLTPRAPVRWELSAWPPAGDGRPAFALDQVRQIPLDGADPQPEQVVVQAVPDRQRGLHGLHLQRCRRLLQPLADLPHCFQVHQRARRLGVREQAGGEAQAVQQRPQLRQQVQRLLVVTARQQQCDGQEPRVLGQVDDAAVLLERREELGLAVVRQEPQVEPLAVRLPGKPWEVGQPSRLRIVQRLLGQVAAGRETAVRDLQRHPGRSVANRRARADGQISGRHAGEHRSPPFGLGSGARPHRRVGAAHRSDKGPLLLPQRVAVVRGAAGLRRHDAPETTRVGQVDAKASPELAPTRGESQELTRLSCFGTTATAGGHGGRSRTCALPVRSRVICLVVSSSRSPITARSFSVTSRADGRAVAAPVRRDRAARRQRRSACARTPPTCGPRVPADARRLMSSLEQARQGQREAHELPSS
jgi:hypothetical protein